MPHTPNREAPRDKGYKHFNQVFANENQRALMKDINLTMKQVKNKISSEK
jgi:hypothetical protein